MQFEPGKFFVGIVDFFAVLLPGAGLVFVGMVASNWTLGAPITNNLGDNAGVAAFLFAAYVLGHFVFLVAAFLLDDLVYNPLRNATRLGHIDRLSRGKGLPWRWLRWLASTKIFFGRDPDSIASEAERVWARALNAPPGARPAVNAYQWSKIWLSKWNPASLVEVQRFEAHSKFFRSFSVVLPFATGVLLCRRCHGWASFSLFLLLLSLWCYANQRFKAVQQAFRSVVSLEGTEGTPLGPPPPPKPNAPTHAGGVVYTEVRVPGAKRPHLRYLFVESSKGGEYVLPKGHIEPGEKPEKTAVREVAEEAGVWAEVVSTLDVVRLGEEADSPFVRFYLMRYVGEVDPKRAAVEDRKVLWAPLADTKLPNEYRETKDLLDAAEARLTQDARRGGRARAGKPPAST